MAELLQRCSVCSKTFVVQFSYQMEEHPRADGAGSEFRFYCSQGCVTASHTASGMVPCDACGAAFTVTRAAQVCYISGKRSYACGDGCREQLLREANGVRLLDEVATPAQVPAQSGAAQGPRVIAVFNHKGGTGKTTTAVTLASGLAERGHRTLLVDTDAQGNVAVSLGMKHPARTLYHVLVMGCPLADATVAPRQDLDVLVANETLAAAELYLAGRKNRDRILASRLADARANYDYVVVDCSPSLSLLNQNALVFSDAVLCPVACDYLSLVGVRQVVKTVKNVNRLLNHPVQLWGVLPTMYDRRARICNEALETLREHFKERCLDPIRSAIRVKEAPSQGKTLFEYDADSSVAQDYGRLVDRVTRSGSAQTTTYLATA